LKRFVSFASLNEADAFLGSYTYYDKNQLAELIEHDISQEYREIREHHHRYFERPKDSDLITKMCYTDLNMFMTSLNLTYTDRASMAASTEVRVPFIDKEVVSLAFRISSEYKISRLRSKYVLKKVAEKWLPKEIIHRPKSSFTMPIRSWIKNDLAELVDDCLLGENGLGSRGCFNKAYLTKLVKNDRAGYEDNAQKLWHLLTLEMWLKQKEKEAA